ncbi:MAG: tyrosine-type recombinase/integrase [Paludibacteraceae bacterium]|nr:tyrosine-type recombinase/integrase [Paludibacteraceae bacterium]
MENRNLLNERFNRDLAICNYSPNTVSIYQLHLKNFFNYFLEKEISEISTEELKDYMHWQLQIKKSSSSYVNGSLACIKFLYNRTLGIAHNFGKFPRPKLPKKLPVILSQQEVRKLIESTENLKHKAILMLLYTSGLRISEFLNLKVTDIDSSRMQIRVRGGKGQKDRYTLLSRVCLNLLRDYWRAYRPKVYLIEGMKAGHPYSENSVRKIIDKGVKKAGIKKHIKIHSMRHSFATHLLENGLDIVHIKNLLGHTSLKTTMIYLHLRQTPELKGKHPLDTIFKDKQK